MKPAFSLVEIIFVMVIMGILFAVSSGSIPSYVQDNDTQKIKFYINQTQLKAMHNNTYMKNGSATWDSYSETNSSCIDFTDLNNNQFNEDNYTISTTVTTSPNSIICFDYMGRPYSANLQIANLLTDFNTITISDPPKPDKEIFITPYSGFTYVE